MSSRTPLRPSGKLSRRSGGAEGDATVENGYPENGRQAARAAVLGIDHVQVAAPPGSEQDARWFYGELLGLAELSKPQPLRARGGVWFACGVHQLHVGIAEPFAPAVKAHPALAVEAAELDPLAARLAEAGREVRWDDAIPGTRRFYTADPWGNRIELLGVKG